MPEPSADISQGATLDKPTVSKSLGKEVQPRPDVQQKQAAWDAKRQEVDGIVDAIGRGLDEGIKESVVAFSMNGLDTSASCEGHLDHGNPTPWIDIKAPNQSKIRFTDETETLQRIADSHGISIEAMKRGQSEEAQNAWFAALAEARENGETPDYQVWRAETEKQGHKTEALLDEFYAVREVSPEARLYTSQGDDEGAWTVMAGTVEEGWDATRSPVETETLLLARRAEMLAFTEFLKQRYLSLDESSEAKSSNTSL